MSIIILIIGPQKTWCSFPEISNPPKTTPICNPEYNQSPGPCFHLLCSPPALSSPPGFRNFCLGLGLSSLLIGPPASTPYALCIHFSRLLYQAPQIGCLKTIDICSLIGLEARSLNEGVCKTPLPLKALGKSPSLPLPASPGHSSPWPPLACSCTTPPSAHLHRLSPRCVSVSSCYKDTSR